MKRILLTGMSGTGKSTVIDRLAARGYEAVDLDCDEFSEWVAVHNDDQIPGSPVEPDKDWVWRENRVQELLSDEIADILFVSGCASNMGKFLPQFDHVVLLSAAPDVIVKRLTTRENNPYGKRPDEVVRVLELRESVEPLLRKAAGFEIDTSTSLDAIMATVLRIAQSEQ